MGGDDGFPLAMLDYVAIVGYFVVLSAIGFWTGRKEKSNADDYFLAGRTLPWYVVGSSFIASNISTEHFIGMIGAAFVYGICVAMSEWANVLSFSVLIWFFIPFLLASRVFTTPEFMEKRFHPILRQAFAVLTIVSNVVAFLAAVLYGGGLALQSLFGWNLHVAIVALAVVAGSWAIYGGLKSVAWTDFFTVIIMLARRADGDRPGPPDALRREPFGGRRLARHDRAQPGSCGYLEGRCRAERSAMRSHRPVQSPGSHPADHA